LVSFTVVKFVVLVYSMITAHEWHRFGVDTSKTLIFLHQYLLMLTIVCWILLADAVSL